MLSNVFPLTLFPSLSCVCLPCVDLSSFLLFRALCTLMAPYMALIRLIWNIIRELVKCGSYVRLPHWVATMSEEGGAGWETTLDSVDVNLFKYLSVALKLAVRFLNVWRKVGRPCTSGGVCTEENVTKTSRICMVLSSQTSKDPCWAFLQKWGFSVTLVVVMKKGMCFLCCIDLESFCPKDVGWGILEMY